MSKNCGTNKICKFKGGIRAYALMGEGVWGGVGDGQKNQFTGGNGRKN